MNKQTYARDRMMWIAYAIGGGVGVAFPLIAGLLVEPKDSFSLVVFWLMSVSAGVAVGGSAYSLSRRAVERSLRGVLDSATRNLGFIASEASN